MFGGAATRGNGPAFECLREPGWGIDDIQFRFRNDAGILDAEDQEDSQRRRLVWGSEGDPAFLSGLWRWQDEAGGRVYQ